MVIIPKLARFARTYPEIMLEVTSSNDPVDLVAREYDAGVQLGEFIQRDMIAVRVTKEMRLAVVGSPAYFKLKGPAPPTGSERPSVHWLSVQQLPLPLGIRKGSEGAHGQPSRACILR
jgi:DNA-binding transcriptional LysR family regulator